MLTSARTAEAVYHHDQGNNYGSSMENRPKVVVPVPQGEGEREVPVATLTAPVLKNQRAVRPQSARFVPPMRDVSSCFDDNFLDVDFVVEIADEEEKADPLLQRAHQLEAWARYGFTELRLVKRPQRRSTGSVGQEGRSSGTHRTQDRRTIGGDGRERVDGTGQGLRDLPDPYEVAGANAGDGGSRTRRNILARNNNQQDQEQEQEHQQPPESPAVLGTATPSTVVLTPTSQEKHPQEGSDANAAGTGVSGINTVVPQASVPVGGDSVATSFLAASLAARVQRGGTDTAAVAASAGEDESKQSERRGTESILGNLDRDSTARRDENDNLDFAGWHHQHPSRRGGINRRRVEPDSSGSPSTSSRASSTGSGGRVRPANTSGRHSSHRVSLRITAEVDKRKRNRTERLWSYGCSRTLYPRIQPEPFSGASDILEEVETKQWIDTLRVSLGLRGETSMAACTATFVQQQTATLLEEQRKEARAARTADVCKMEGPDGLLHCAVLKGDHPLAARAAQFLVDKGGANVNSRDEWGRTPLHTASGKGIVSMARFFVRRGANVDARDMDNRTPLYFACAGGHTTVAKYLTRVEVGARVELRDCLGHLAGEYFWDSVSEERQEEIIAVLEVVGWPNPPQEWESRGRCSKRGMGCGRKGHARDRPRSEQPRRRSVSLRGPEAGPREEVGMKRLATEMRLLMRRL